MVKIRINLSFDEEADKRFLQWLYDYMQTSRIQTPSQAIKRICIDYSKDRMSYIYAEEYLELREKIKQKTGKRHNK